MDLGLRCKFCNEDVRDGGVHHCPSTEQSYHVEDDAINFLDNIDEFFGEETGMLPDSDPRDGFTEHNIFDEMFDNIEDSLPD